MDEWSIARCLTSSMNSTRSWKSKYNNFYWTLGHTNIIEIEYNAQKTNWGGGGLRKVHKKHFLQNPKCQFLIPSRERWPFRPWSGQKAKANRKWLDHIQFEAENWKWKIKLEILERVEEYLEWAKWILALNPFCVFRRK